MIVNKPLFDECSDYELAKMVRENSPNAKEALQALYSRHSGVFNIKLMHLQKNDFFGSGVYLHEDLWEDKAYIFYLACKDFDPEKSRFSTYLGQTAWFYAKNKVNKAERHQFNCDSMDEEACYGIPDANIGAEDITNREFLSDALEYLKRSQSERDYYCFEENFINGRTLEDIGQSIGLTRERVRQIVFDMRKNILNHYSTNNYDLA